MNKTTATILGGAVIVAGAVLLTGSVQSATTVEKVDKDTVQITTPVQVKIADLKEQLEQLQANKNLLQNDKKIYSDDFDAKIVAIQLEIDKTKDLIAQAKAAGVE